MRVISVGRSDASAMGVPDDKESGRPSAPAWHRRLWGPAPPPGYEASELVRFSNF